MTLEFNRKPKKKMVGVRLTEKEFKFIKVFAKRHDTSIAEVCRILMLSAMNDIDGWKKIK